MHLPDKIYIIGGSWSGKSSLAKKISKIKNIPHFELDDILRSKKYIEKLAQEKRISVVHSLLEKNKKRIIDWFALDRADECYKKSDLVIVLNVSKFTVAWRLIKRYLTKVMHWDFTQTFRWLLWLIQRAMTYQNPKSTHSFRRQIEDCKKYKCNYIIIRDAKEILY